MSRHLLKMLCLIVLVIAGGAGVFYYQQTFSDQARIDQLTRQNEALELIVERLGSERRIAQVLVSDQHRDEQGVLVTTLLFVEEARDGRTLEPRQITVRGDHVYLDALVIKFDTEFLKTGDALRGQSLALFDKIFGSAQRPQDATRLDEPGRIPAIYRGVDPRITRFEQELWDQFWKLATDRDYAKSQGVRVAQGQSTYGPFQPNQHYTLTIEPTGNINMTAQPVPAVYREWIKSVTPR